MSVSAEESESNSGHEEEEAQERRPKLQKEAGAEKDRSRDWRTRRMGGEAQSCQPGKADRGGPVAGTRKRRPADETRRGVEVCFLSRPRKWVEADGIDSR